MNEFYNSIPSNCTEYTRRRPLAHTSHPASHVLRLRKFVPRLTSKATTTTTDGGGGGTTGGVAGSSTLNTMMSAACKTAFSGHCPDWFDGLRVVNVKDGWEFYVFCLTFIHTKVEFQRQILCVITPTHIRTQIIWIVFPVHDSNRS